MNSRRSSEGNARRTVRTFIAIDMDRTVRRAISVTQDKLMRRTPEGSVRWVRPEGIHLTLKFLGDTPSDRLEEVKVALRAAAQGVSPFEISVEDLGCFPHTRGPRVVWLGVKEPTGALQSLWQAVEQRVAPLGWPTESRGFHPHLTLGRVQRRAGNSERRALGELVERAKLGRLATMSVRSVCFIKSDLRPSGAVYTTLDEVELGPDRR